MSALREASQARAAAGALHRPTSRPVMRHRGWPWLVLLGVALAYVALAGTSLLQKSVTVDEFGHLPAGLNLLGYGDLHYAQLNPPLMNLLAALPLRIRGAPAVPREGIPFQRRYDFWVNGYGFMNTHSADYHELYVTARWVTVLLIALLGLLVFLWARMLVPQKAALAGLLAAGLVWFSPNMLAHARLVTTDAGLALFMMLALFTLYLFLRRPSIAMALACGVSLGLAQLVKFSAVYLYLTHLIMILIWLPTLPRAARLRGLALACGVLVVSLVVIDAGYAFARVGRMVGEFTFASGPGRALAGMLPERLLLPLPEDYLRAFDRQLLDSQQGDPSYLLGRSYDGGHWSYFVVLLFTKLPLPTLLLAGIAIGVRLARRGECRGDPPGRSSGVRGPASAAADSAASGERPPEPHPRPRVELLILLPAGVLFAAFSLLSQKQLGLRMILPCLVMLWLWVAVVLADACRSRRFAALIVGLCLWLGIETAVAHPDYLPYFNELAGGSAGGYRVAVDSNCDWGQDLPRLARYLEAHGLAEIQLLYFGRVDPALYGIEYRVPLTGPQPGRLAVSRTLYGRGYWLHDHGRIVWGGPFSLATNPHARRVTTLGHSIDIYEIEPASP